MAVSGGVEQRDAGPGIPSLTEDEEELPSEVKHIHTHLHSHTLIHTHTQFISTYYITIIDIIEVYKDTHFCLSGLLKCTGP